MLFNSVQVQQGMGQANNQKVLYRYNALSGLSPVWAATHLELRHDCTAHGATPERPPFTPHACAQTLSVAVISTQHSSPSIL